MKTAMLLKNNNGFTLVEVLVTGGIIAIVIVVLLQLLVYCSVLTEHSINKIVAMSEAQERLEEIKNHAHASVVTNYSVGGSPGNTFDLNQLDGKGAIYIDSANPALLQIKIAVSWSNKNNRITGEDTNLNGILDAGEDKNANGELDSSVSLATLIAQK